MGASNLNSEKELLLDVAGGSALAFQQLFAQYKDHVYSLALHISGSEDFAADILQDVFLKIWLKRQGLTEIENFTGYLVVVSKRMIINELQRIKTLRKKESQSSDTLQLISEETEKQLNYKQLQEMINRAVERLPARQAAVFRLIKQQGYSREEAAKALQITSETVKKHLEKAIRTLRAVCISHAELFAFFLIFN